MSLATCCVAVLRESYGSGISTAADLRGLTGSPIRSRRDGGEVLWPTYEGIRELALEEGGILVICLSADNPNPRLFKRHFRLFTIASPWEGAEFLEQAPRLCVGEAERAVQTDLQRGMMVWSYIDRLPRWDPAQMPGDLTHPRWREIEQWAVAFDDDLDPLMNSGER